MHGPEARVTGSAPGLLLPAMSLARRELVRFIRQPNRVVGALATPIVFWLLIGAGMGSSFKSDAVSGNYIRYFFPGTILMILLFTAIFSTISIIEDRREGFLQSVLVAPVGRMAIVLGKVLGGTVLAFGQGLIFLILAPTVHIQLSPLTFLLAALMMFLLSFALTALGFCIAWRMSSTQGFHAIMNLFLMPMWFLSGALFPADQAWGAVRWIMRLYSSASRLQPSDANMRLLRSAAVAAFFAVTASVASAPATAAPSAGRRCPSTSQSRFSSH